MADRRYTNPKTGEIIDDPEIRPFVTCDMCGAKNPSVSWRRL